MTPVEHGIDTLRWRVDQLKEADDERCEELKELDRRLKAVEIELGKLGVKMGIWAAVGAAIPIVAAYILQLLR